MSDKNTDNDDVPKAGQQEGVESADADTDEPESASATSSSGREKTEQTAADTDSSAPNEEATNKTDDSAIPVDGNKKEAPDGDSSDDEETIQDNIGALRKEIDQLRQTVEESRKQIEQLEAKVEDYERRNSHEHENIKKYATEDLAGEMLRVKDMLEDAIAMENLEEGTERRLGAVTKQFDKTITSGSIERIQPEPQELYDDKYHRMVDKVNTDEYEPEQIVDLVEDGYRTHDRVIRPARVTVATGTSE